MTPLPLDFEQLADQLNLVIHHQLPILLRFFDKVADRQRQHQPFCIVLASFFIPSQLS